MCSSYDRIFVSQFDQGLPSFQEIHCQQILTSLNPNNFVRLWVVIRAHHLIQGRIQEFYSGWAPFVFWFLKFFVLVHQSRILNPRSRISSVSDEKERIGVKISRKKKIPIFHYSVCFEEKKKGVIFHRKLWVNLNLPLIKKSSNILLIDS